MGTVYCVAKKMKIFILLVGITLGQRVIKPEQMVANGDMDPYDYLNNFVNYEKRDFVNYGKRLSETSEMEKAKRFEIPSLPNGKQMLQLEKLMKQLREIGEN